MTREEVMKRLDVGELTTAQAASMLGLSERQVRRVRRRFEKEGGDGLRDMRTAERPGRRVAGDVVQQVLHHFRRYDDFSMTHFHEKLVEVHDVKISYSSVRRILQRGKLVEKAERRGRYRRRRARQPMVGMRVHLDGSTHAWFGEDHPMVDLIVAMDDADGRILSARFVEQEGTLSTFSALFDVLSRHGRFCELYVDRGSHHFPFEDVREHQLTRVLQALSIRPIYARSPQARGRSERMFGTLQGRLPQELRLARIHTIDEANRFLETTFVEDFNRRFAVVPKEPSSAFTPLPNTLDLTLLLSIHNHRVLRNDFTVRHKRRVLQLPASASLAPKAKVIVHTFLDGSLGVSKNGNLLATFQRDGTPIHARDHTSESQKYTPKLRPASPHAGDVMFTGGGHL